MHLSNSFNHIILNILKKKTKYTGTSFFLTSLQALPNKPWKSQSKAFFQKKLF